MTVLCSLSHILLVKIFSFLQISDRKNILYVSSYVGKVASDPILWQNASINKTKLVAEMDDFFSLKKFCLLICFDMSGLRFHFQDQSVITKLIKYFQVNTNLKTVDFTNNDLSKIPSFPLASALSHCQTLGLAQTKLQTEQINNLLGKCCAGKFTKNTDFSFNDFTYVNADLLARSIQSLDKINLSYTELTAVDTSRIMETVTNSKIQEIDLSGNDLSLCKFDNLGLNQNLTVLKLSEVKLNPQNLNYIFPNLSLLPNLQELILNGSVLSETEPVLLADAVAGISKVELNYCWLYCEHIEYIMAGITETTNIKQLNLSGNHFENVNRDLILEAANHLDVLRVEWANMTEEQFETLVSDTSDMKHKKLILNHYELIENHLDLHRIAKQNSNIVLNMVQG